MAGVSTGVLMTDRMNKKNKTDNVPHDEKSLEKVLRKYFGYSSFRPGQYDIISSVLSGRDTLAVMPTGGGKSLCYQIPSLVLPGLTVVVSPLIALMQDQVSQLDEAGVPSLFLNSTLEWEQYVSNMDRIRNGEIKLLYCAPETLVTERVRNLLHQVDVSCFTIDEAHCISEWGHDFRPEYRRISEIRSFFPDAVCLALTATATETVRKDIRHSLGMEDAAEFISSFDRPNIYLEVLPKTGSGNTGEKDASGRKLTRAEELTLGFVRTHPEESGIIYCFSRNQVDKLTEMLNGKNIMALPYHAGLSDEERSRNQTKFVRDEVSVVVATVAFGMGINKPNVRYVIHYDLPKSLEQYYQEIGRAGRDGEPSHALLLYSYADCRKIKFFMAEKEGVELEAARKQLESMISYAECHTCRRSRLLEYFGETLNRVQDGGASCCDVCGGSATVSVDVTIPVQKLLSCIIRTEQRFGAAYVIDVLLGSKQQRILDNGHDKLSVWGIGKEYSRNDWFALIRLLLEKELLVKDSEYQVLSLTREAADKLRKRDVFMLPFVPSGKTGYADSQKLAAENRKGSVPAKGSQELDDSGLIIYEELRVLRKKLAEKADVPAYVIFGDRTVRDIAEKKPSEKEALYGIYGIGEKKLEQYGDFIVHTVRKCLGLKEKQ